MDVCATHLLYLLYCEGERVFLCINLMCYVVAAAAAVVVVVDNVLLRSW